MQPLQPLLFKAGIDASPITITDWQFKYAQTYGNYPEFMIKEVQNDPFGNPSERKVNDAEIFTYTVSNRLDRVMIIYGSGTLLNDLIITIK